MRSSRPYRSPNAAMFWSMMLPGFGQLYNRDYLIGIVLLGCEFIINLKSHLNLALITSFKGDLLSAHEIIHYDWGLFYPSIYAYAMWQAYNEAKAQNAKLEGKEVITRTYLSGFFLGIVVGMDGGLIFHDNRYVQLVSILDFPVYNGLISGFLLGILGHVLENKVYRKYKKT